MTKIFNLNTVLFLLLLLAIIISIQQYLLPEAIFFGKSYPHYNNFLIFKHSFKHLLENTNLYAFYPDEYGDLFKYSPTFALSMGFFYYLPDWLGLIFWNILNVSILFFGIKSLPNIDDRSKVFIILFVLLELIGNIQNEQSNALMCGLIVLSFVFFERKNLLLATLFIALSIYIKLFGLVAVALFILYPNRFRFIAYLGFWLLVLWTVPLLIISPTDLFEQYNNWIELLKTDHASLYGFSVYGILQKWFGLEPSKWIVSIVGILLFSSVYIRKDLFKDTTFRFLMLASILMWVNLFNHIAESSGYILSMTGIGIWYFSQEKSRINNSLIILAFVFVSLIYSDITPAYYRLNFLLPYYVKTIPAIFIWLRVLYEMLFKKYHIKATS